MPLLFGRIRKIHLTNVSLQGTFAKPGSHPECNEGFPFQRQQMDTGDSSTSSE
ncbi:hypothetical protein G3569_12615 [Aliifodinibius halophilus]|uniref:Uncharacterized protein n=1 Tax=Fodinibius halophilus TaxID=1736908 RepID=A0A6M1T769_9BACT|nr:hypothetical protein [Fodinibius halophilus]